MSFFFFEIIMKFRINLMASSIKERVFLNFFLAVLKYYGNILKNSASFITIEPLIKLHLIVVERLALLIYMLALFYMLSNWADPIILYSFVYQYICEFVGSMSEYRFSCDYLLRKPDIDLKNIFLWDIIEHFIETVRNQCWQPEITFFHLKIL